MTTIDTRGDVVADDVYPIAAICGALGVPRKDWRLFARWAERLPAQKELDELHAYVDVMIADRCRKPTDDLLSRLIQVEFDGDELTVDDVRELVAALVAGAAFRRADARCPDTPRK